MESHSSNDNSGGLGRGNSTSTGINDLSFGGTRRNPSSATTTNNNTEKDFIALQSHPLLANGVSYAKHEAIRNAHFASKCCVCMTNTDWSLINPINDSSTSSSNKGIDTQNTAKNNITTAEAVSSPSTTSFSLTMFQQHVDNPFIQEMEHLVSRCLIQTLDIVTQSHYSTSTSLSSSSFVSFTQEEAESISDISALLKPGQVICLWSSPSSSYIMNPTLQYAKVL